MRKTTLILVAAFTISAFAGQGLAQQPAAPASDEPQTWLAAGEQYAAAEMATEPAAAQPRFTKTPPPGMTYVPYDQRRGPAYPGDCLTSIGRDAKELLPMFWEDTKAVYTNPCGLAVMGVGIAAGLAIQGENGDDNVSNHYTRHGSQLGHFWDSLGDAGGNPGTHFGIAGAMYFTGLATGDDKTYEVAKTMLSALTINGLTTMALKGIAHDHSPNGDPLGWPSGHTSSSFCMATIVYDSYGPWAGAAAYAFAGFVGYERVDARNHNLSDVISGAVIGTVIGHLVAKNHEAKIFGMTLVPYSDDRGAMGLALAKQW